jgi:hypothetical protein
MTYLRLGVICCIQDLLHGAGTFVGVRVVVALLEATVKIVMCTVGWWYLSI